jgi:hypothetical protein
VGFLESNHGEVSMLDVNFPPPRRRNKSFRLTEETLTQLAELAKAYRTTEVYVFEALMKEYGPKLLAQKGRGK